MRCGGGDASDQQAPVVEAGIEGHERDTFIQAVSELLALLDEEAADAVSRDPAPSGTWRRRWRRRIASG